MKINSLESISRASSVIARAKNWENVRSNSSLNNEGIIVVEAEKLNAFLLKNTKKVSSKGIRKATAKGSLSLRETATKTVKPLRNKKA